MNDNQGLVWHTEKRKVSSLIPMPDNPRHLTDQQRTDLETSLKRFNLVEIPAVNTDGKIIAGHQRVMLLVALGRGDEEIDVRIPNRTLTEAEVKEYNIRSNKNTGEWDIEVLKANFDLNELLGWGFTHQDFEDLTLEIPNFNPVPEDEQPRLDEKKMVICPECGHEFTP
jgi:ParB-like chromosome segregation protein Spo0J